MPFTLTLPYVPLRTGSTSSSSGYNNEVEISSDLQVIESAAAAAVPSAKVGPQKLAAKASSSFMQLR